MAKEKTFVLEETISEFRGGGVAALVLLSESLTLLEQKQEVISEQCFYCFAAESHKILRTVALNISLEIILVH